MSEERVRSPARSARQLPRARLPPDAVGIFEGKLWAADAITNTNANADSSAKQQLDHGPGHLIAKILGAHTIAVILCAAR